MAKTPSRNRKITIFFSTFLILAVAGFGYFYLYTQQREAALRSRHYRVLDQICDNVLIQYENYQTNVNSNATRNLSALKNEAIIIFHKKAKEEDEKILNELKKFEDSSNPVEHPSTSITIPPGAIYFKGDTILVNRSELETSIKTGIINLKDSTIITAPTKGNVLRKSNTINQYYQEAIDKITESTLLLKELEEEYNRKINLKYRIVVNDNEENNGGKATNPDKTFLRESGQEWDIVHSFAIEDNKNWQGELARPVSQLITRVLRDDIFDELVVFWENTDSSLEIDTGFHSIYQTMDLDFASEELERNIDSLLKVQLKPKLRHKLEGVPYQIYLKPLQLSQNDYFYVCGLIDQSRFNLERAQIPMVIILLLVIIALLLVLSIPILKLRLIGKNESIGIIDVILSLVSFILGTWLMVLLLVDGYRFLVQDEITSKNQLENLHENISEGFFTELDAIYRQLTYYDELRQKPDPVLTENVYLNSLASSSDTIYPHHYPFYNTVLWPNKKGLLNFEVAPDSTKTANINISGRQYLERFRENQPWQLKDSLLEGDFFLEAILSRTNGNQYASISKRSDLPNAPIVFMTTYLYSVIRPILPQGFGFAIIDDKGDVLFHSDQSKNLQENFFAESNNQDFRSAIFSRVELHSTGNYLGVDHEFFIKPLRQLPLYLITFEDKTYQRLSHSQVLGLNFILALLFLLSAIFFLALLYLLSPKTQTYKQNTFLLDWLKPRSGNMKNYQILSLVNLSLLFLLIGFSWNAAPPTIISLILISNFYAFLLAFLYLNLNSYQEFDWDKQQQHLLAQLIIFVLLHFFLFMAANPNKLRILLFEVLPFSLVVYRVLKISPRMKNRITTIIPQQPIVTGNRTLINVPKIPLNIQERINELIGGKRSYRFFFLTWLTISSVFPGIKFYEISYDYEQRLLVQWTQVEMVNDIKNRNQWIESIYRNGYTPNSRLDSIKQARKHLAIYSKAFFNTSMKSYEELNLGLELVLADLKENLILAASNTGEQEFTLSLLEDTAQFKTNSVGPFLVDLPINLVRDGASYTTRVQNAPKNSPPFIGFDSIPFSLLDSEEDVSTDTLVFLNSPQISYADYFNTAKILKLEPFKLPAKDFPVRYQLKNTSNEIVDSGSVVASLQPFLSDTMEGYHQEAEASLFDLLSGMRLLYNETVRQTSRFNEQQSANKLWFWRQHDQKLHYFNEGERIYLSSEFNNYSFPIPFNKHIGSSWIFFWIFLLVIFYFIYQTLDFQVDHLFAQHALDRGYLPQLSNKKWLLNTPDHVFLVVPPTPISSDYTEVLKWKTENFKGDDEAEPLFINMASEIQPDLKKDQFKTLKDAPFLVLNNFDRYIEEPDVFRNRIHFLSQLDEQFPDKQLILISAHDQIKVKEILESEDEEMEGNKKSKWDLRRNEKNWRRFLSGFVKIIYPPDRWERLVKTDDMLRLSEQGSSYFQIAPSRFTEMADLIDKKNKVGRFRFFPMEQKPYCYEWVAHQDDRELLGNMILLDHRQAFSSFSHQLEFMETKMEAGERVHILANFTPVDFLRFYDQAIKRTSKAKQKPLREEREKWSRILLQLRKGLVLLDLSRSKKANRPIKAQNRILKECSNGDYLQSIQAKLIEQFGDGSVSDQEIIRNIEIRAQLYYQALWNSLPDDEQFLVFELAQDGIANGRNREVFNNLVRKGIIITAGDSPVIMNKSFRNFIMSIAAPEKVRERARKSSDELTWNNLRWPIVIVLLVLLTFLFATQKEFADKSLALFTGLAAVVPVIAGIVTSVTTLSSKMPGISFLKFGKKNT